MKKKVNVVMLPAETASTLCMIVHKNELAYTPDNEVSKTKRIINQHLYFTTDEEIKEGDWGIGYEHGTKKPYLFRHNADKVSKLNALCKESRKIVATTDPDLWDSIDKSVKPSKFKAGVDRIGEDFLQAFVREQGKITEVMLEYENDMYCNNACGAGIDTTKDNSHFKCGCGQGRFVSSLPKLRSNGTVIISRVEETWDDIFERFVTEHRNYFPKTVLKSWLIKNYKVPRRKDE